MAATPEHSVKMKVRRMLDGIGCYTFMPVQFGYGPDGLDYFCCINGRFVAIETKAPGKKLTTRQVATAIRIVKSGGLVLVIRGAHDIAPVHDVIRQNRSGVYDTLGTTQQYGDCLQWPHP